MTPRGLPSRAGMWSAQHRKTAIWGWLAFVVIALFIGNAVGTKTLEHNEGSVGESGRADQTIADAAPKHAQEMVLIQSSGATAARSRVSARWSPTCSESSLPCPTHRTSRAHWSPHTRT